MILVFSSLMKIADISDMGYQMNNDMVWAGGQNGLKYTDFDESSVLLSSEYEFGFGYEANADLENPVFLALLQIKVLLRILLF